MSGSTEFTHHFRTIASGSYAMRASGPLLLTVGTRRGITAHVPHTSDVGFSRRNFAEPERGSTKRFDWLCRFSLSILDRFGPRASTIPNSASLLRMRSIGFDSHRSLHNSPFSEDVRFLCLRFAFPLRKAARKTNSLVLTACRNGSCTARLSVIVRKIFDGTTIFGSRDILSIQELFPSPGCSFIAPACPL